MVTAGSMTANVASYGLQLVASWWLGPAGYGEFASLLAAQLVLAVPALALQTVVAREQVHGAPVPALRRLTYRTAAIVGVLALVAVPAAAWALDTGVVATAAALLSAPVLVLLGGEQGLLQGQARFAGLSVVLAGAGVAKVVPAVVLLALTSSAGPALLASTLGTALLVVLTRVFAHTEHAGSTAGHVVGATAVLRASQVQLALIAMSSVDLLIARIVLPVDDAGLYALGAVATKAAFWLPQAVGVVLYPRMADPAQSGRAVRSALTVLCGIGALVVAGAAIAAPLLPLVVGDAYRPVQSLLWAFALQGACLAVVQGALLSAIAGGRTRLAAVAWAALAVEVAVMFAVAGTVGQLIAIAAVAAALTAVAASVLALRAAR
ncbi:polysaccharide biosynthesis protein [Rhodococcus sp. HNM0569]|uniref:polysaccharide biosynthesis protein n=1 Tax=Rhodococcus sp. HNM0569 TaxID=2716340 RepID=UPI00197CCAB3|nr:polysaccharide biosynthesis protein [Rhodococcus sp. HNM0569]